MSYEKKIKLINEYVLLKEKDIPQTIGKIALPSTTMKDIVSQRGEVIDVDVDHGDKNIKIGDDILFKKNRFKSIEIDEDKYLLVKKSDILAIMFGENATDLTPLNDKIFIEWEEAKKEYWTNGLIRPENYRKAHYTGIVISIGPDVKEVNIGERVFFDQFPDNYGINDKFEEDGKRYTFLRIENIFAIGLEKRTEVIL